MDRQWRVKLSGFGGCFESEDVLFEEILLDKPFHVLPEGPSMDNLVFLIVIIAAIFSALGSEGSYQIGLRRLTHGYP